MIFTLYKTAREFADDASETLFKFAIQNNILIKNLNGGLSREDTSDMLMATVKDDDEKVLLTVIRTSPHPMVMFETDNIRNDEAVEFFVDGLIEHYIEVDIFMTEKELAKSFKNIYGRKTGLSFRNNENLVLYLLEKVNELEFPRGSFRAATNEDMFYLPYWYGDFMPACHLGEWNIVDGIQMAQNAIDNNKPYIWEDGTPVSLAANVRHINDCFFIGTVYTPPNFRGRGYSTACVASLSQKLFDEGAKFCALYADCANPYSNKVYQNIGFKEIFYYDQYKLI
jgi:predicted GNAT family acetyltransferase